MHYLPTKKFPDATLNSLLNLLFVCSFFIALSTHVEYQLFHYGAEFSKNNFCIVVEL